MAILPYINYDKSGEQAKIDGNNSIKDLLVKAGEAYATGGMSAIGGPTSASDKAKIGESNAIASKAKSGQDAQSQQLHDEAMQYLHTTLLNPQSPGYNPTLAPGYAHAHGIELSQDQPQQPDFGNGLMTPQGY
jgi:hypothetical protein